MTDNSIREDLRVLKTYKALVDSLAALLEYQNFSQLTVNEICSEAMVSRATFYAHFNDKYDLLRFWLDNVKIKINLPETPRHFEKSANQFIYYNKNVIKNIVENANSETLKLLYNSFLTHSGVGSFENTGGALVLKHIVLSNFYAGGMLSYLSWHVENRFPPDLPFVNKQLIDVLNMLRNLESENGLG